MSGAIRASETRQVVGRRVVRKPPVLRPHEEVPRQIEISSTAVDERGARLRTGSGKILGVKDQTADSRQHERREVTPRQTEDIGGSHFMGIALDSEKSARKAVVLRVQRIAVVGFNTVVCVEEIAIG